MVNGAALFPDTRSVFKHAGAQEITRQSKQKQGTVRNDDGHPTEVCAGHLKWN